MKEKFQFVRGSGLGLKNNGDLDNLQKIYRNKVK